MKLELGGGENPQKKAEGFMNVDRVEIPGVDIVMDFETDNFPYFPKTVDYIYCRHCLEHIENVRHFLNECHRILKAEGTAEFIVPYGLWEGACKPIHKQMITACWFDFLRKENSFKLYGFKRWEIIELQELLGKKEEKYEIICKMKPVK